VDIALACGAAGVHLGQQPLKLSRVAFDWWRVAFRSAGNGRLDMCGRREETQYHSGSFEKPSTTELLLSFHGPSSSLIKWYFTRSQNDAQLPNL
jgi:hypothetical protein